MNKTSHSYVSRTTPGYAAVRGEADPDATVTVNGNPTFRLGAYYFGSDNFDNTSNGGFAELETYAALAQTNADGEETDDLVSSVTNQVYLAQSPETFAYDADGNQTLIATKTGLWRVTYNGENRPVRWVRDSDGAVITMSYDHMGRRRTKNSKRFYYDGYLQVADSDGNRYVWDPTEPTATRPLAWMHGETISYYTHDGNKNVSEVITNDGTVAAHYEYAPFGATILQRGDSLSTNPWRFSSEYAEDDTATVYYNYRHYEPVIGRWLSRDSIGEVDVSLYVFLCNDMLGYTDRLGCVSESEKICNKVLKDIWGKDSYLKNWFKENAPIGCMMPRVLCKECCDENELGNTVGRSNTGSMSDITLCAMKGRNASDYSSTLQHELIHAIDLCKVKKSRFNCEEAVQSEINAYRVGSCASLSEPKQTQCVRNMAKKSAIRYFRCRGQNIDKIIEKILRKEKHGY